MIVVEVKLVSARGREHDKLLGTAVIANVGTTEDGRHADSPEQDPEFDDGRS